MAFFIIALSSGPLVQASQETPKLRATEPQAEPPRKLNLKKGDYCEFAECGVEMRCRNRKCETQELGTWSYAESPCLTRLDERLDWESGRRKTTRTIQIVTGAEKNRLSRPECERACKVQPGATACQWENQYSGEFGNFYGEDLGRCRYFTDDDATDIRDCQYVWWDTLSTDPDAEPCLGNYDGNAEHCMVFGAKVEQKRSKKCKGKDFRDRYNPDDGKFKGIKVFNCGKNKTKTKCKLGCKRGYILTEEKKFGAPPNKKSDGTPVRGGTISKYTAHCINGEVIHGMLPICDK